MQHFFMLKTLNKLGLEEKYLNIYGNSVKIQRGKRKSFQQIVKEGSWTLT